MSINPPPLALGNKRVVRIVMKICVIKIGRVIEEKAEKSLQTYVQNNTYYKDNTDVWLPK